MEYINVKELVTSYRAELKQQVDDMIKVGIKTPVLKIILVGENPASLSYIKGKMLAATQVGIDAEVLQLPITTSEQTLLEQIQLLNADDTVHGYIVQLPLPPQINETNILQAVDPLKDVDGFHPENLGNVLLNDAELMPCTPKGIMKILDYYVGDISGLHVVVVGRSNIVGKPMALLALNANATVTITHSHTNNLAEITKQADILIVAIGRAKFITDKFIKKDVTIIDVGINKDSVTNKLVGDVDTESVSLLAKAVTPVPGGVGPMTITMLLENTIIAARNQQI